MKYRPFSQEDHEEGGVSVKPESHTELLCHQTSGRMFEIKETIDDLFTNLSLSKNKNEEFQIGDSVTSWYIDNWDLYISESVPPGYDTLQAKSLRLYIYTVSTYRMFRENVQEPSHVYLIYRPPSSIENGSSIANPFMRDIIS